MVRCCPSFIQETVVAGDTVDTHVSVRLSSWWVRSVMMGLPVAGERMTSLLTLHTRTIATQLTNESTRIESNVDDNLTAITARNSAGVYALFCSSD